MRVSKWNHISKFPNMPKTLRQYHNMVVWCCAQNWTHRRPHMTLLRITARQPAVIECRCSPAILALSLADQEMRSLSVDYRAAAGYELRTTTTTANVLNTEKISVRISSSLLLLG